MVLASVLAVVWIASAAPAVSGPPEGESAAPARVGRLEALSAAERRAFTGSLSRPELEALLRASAPESLLKIARQSVASLGQYRLRMTKQERVGGELLDAQEIDAWIRETPYATRLDYLKGPKAGRRLIYNASLRQGEFRVRESGLLGLTPLWVGLESSLAKGDTNHRVDEMGFGQLLGYLERDLDRGKKVGGFQLDHEGFDDAGSWCVRFERPKGATGFYAARARICSDVALGLPVKLEVWDDAGLRERFAFQRVQGNLQLDPAFFTPEHAGL